MVLLILKPPPPPPPLPQAGMPHGSAGSTTGPASPLERHQLGNSGTLRAGQGTACTRQKRNEKLLSFGLTPRTG